MNSDTRDSFVKQFTTLADRFLDLRFSPADQLKHFKKLVLAGDRLLVESNKCGHLNEIRESLSSLRRRFHAFSGFVGYDACCIRKIKNQVEQAANEADIDNVDENDSHVNEDDLAQFDPSRFPHYFLAPGSVARLDIRFEPMDLSAMAPLVILRVCGELQAEHYNQIFEKLAFEILGKYADASRLLATVLERESPMLKDGPLKYELHEASRTLCIGGHELEAFTAKPFEVVKVLFEAYQNGHPVITKVNLNRECQNNMALRNQGLFRVFEIRRKGSKTRRHPVYSLIQKEGDRYRLIEVRSQTELQRILGSPVKKTS